MHSLMHALMHAPYHPSIQACMQLLLTNTKGLEQCLHTNCNMAAVFTGWHNVGTLEKLLSLFLATVVSADHARLPGLLQTCTSSKLGGGEGGGGCGSAEPQQCCL